MMMIPVQFKPGILTVFIIMSDENIERIKDYDPAQIDWDKLPEECKQAKLESIHLCYANKAEREAIEAAAKKEDFKEMIRVIRTLGRNFRYRPDAGDPDGPYESLKPNQDSFGA